MRLNVVHWGNDSSLDFHHSSGFISLHHKHCLILEPIVPAYASFEIFGHAKNYVGLIYMSPVHSTGNQ